MIILAFHGGLSLVNENRLRVHSNERHDSGAVLIEDGRIVCAFEEERLNRIKHSNKLPLLSINACLRKYAIGADQIDLIVFPMEERICDSAMRRLNASIPSFSFLSAREYIAAIFMDYFFCKIDLEKIVFVNHHLAHAASSYYVSGFDESLIIALDGEGDLFSGGVYTAAGARIDKIRTFCLENSIGNFYSEITSLLGFDFFDEYKVMGLASYGDPQKYRAYFRGLYSLKPDGDFDIDIERLKKERSLLPGRAPGAPVTEEHKDLAAALQYALEEIVIHIASYYRKSTQLRFLCLAGGVALNCSMSGKLNYLGLFDSIFVQPASNDGGLALGAALAAYYANKKEAKRYAMGPVYLGSKCPSFDECRQIVSTWHDFLNFEKACDIHSQTASLIEKGNVIAWFRGASEFGPRALGNRSILADPRPAKNRDLINLKIKMREGFRPFALSVLDEYAETIFEMPEKKCDYSYMTFILRIKEGYRRQLGAVTHVNGTARLQTVSPKQNKSYYNLIDEFGRLTGMPVILNTSFNNNFEPIVDDPWQAINCFLTTDLDYLIIDDLLIGKKEYYRKRLLSLYSIVPPFVRTDCAKKNGQMKFYIGNTYNDDLYMVSSTVYALMQLSDGNRTLEDLLLDQPGIDDKKVNAFMEEILALWGRRLIDMKPVALVAGRYNKC